MVLIRMKLSSNRAHGNVLIVTDRASVWSGVEATLRGCGFSIGRASTREEAFMRLRRNDYDAILLDLGLPGMGGVRACTHVRTEFPSVWIIAVAARDSMEDRVNALNAGADHCITIPFHLREFAARIRAIVRRLRPTAQHNKVSARGWYFSPRHSKACRYARRARNSPYNNRIQSPSIN